MASNTQQFGTRYDDPPRRSNEVSIAAFDDRLNELTSLVKKLAVERTQHVKACGICTSLGHVTDMCPTLQEGPTEHADAIGGFSGQQQRRYDPFSNTYNPGWKDHPNLSYGAQSQNFHRRQYRPPMPPPFNPKQAALQTVINPKQNASAIVLRTGKELQENTDENGTKRGHAQKRKPEKEVEIQKDQDDETKEDNPKVLVTRPPFPERFAKSKKDEETKEILETFRKVEVNIPLLDAIKQIPRYARFLKELCTSKGKLKGNEQASMGENVSAILQRKLPPKCKDPGTFTIPCKIGLIGIKKAMCDLGASINVMPLSIFESLYVGPLKETGVVIQLADRSVVYPEGVLEDVLVQVNELVFPTDFYVLDMREDNSPSSTSILLGRPFLRTARTKINVHSGILSMEFDGEIIKFNIYDSMRCLSDIPKALLVDIVDPFVQALSSTNSEDHVKFVLEESLTPMLVQILEQDMTVDPNISESVFELESLSSLPLNLAFIELPQSRTKLLPSILQAPALELKELPNHLKYAYLGENNTLPVIISSKILLEEGTKPSREAQRRLNPPIMEVVKKEIFKLLDAGFHQIPVAPADQDKTTFTCPFGTFAYRRMPFGLCNAPATFQRCMDSIDDSSRISRKLPNHYAHCYKKMQISNLMVHVAAFDKLKESLTSAPVIRSPDWNLPFEIMCDASNHAIGAVLGQRIGKSPT
ncbi:UNVERIFIED_CONTAM: Retrovirus-related Pol polyprotein from transposon.6 [Sesamum angustifolium]|uniref:Retrovirus-related Pol polyprotein from transposon.6 n=1 Tax=Sesamum angustifolium TaxID=2727405 RepID=A0AAW2QS87_9LAMI